MELTQEVFERIERYCLGKMSSAEKGAFEAELISNPELKSEVEIFRQSVLAVKMNVFKNALQNIPESSEAVTKIKSYRWLYAAASVVVLLSAGWYFFLRTSENDRLFAQYVTVDPGLPVPMSASDDFAFHDAMVDYKNELYEKAIGKWKAQEVVTIPNDTLEFYIACSQFNLRQFDFAAPTFEKLARNNKSNFSDKAHWYHVLCCLQNGQESRILELASQTNSNSPYKEKIDKIAQRFKY